MAPLSTLITGDKAKVMLIEDKRILSIDGTTSLGGRIEEIGLRVGKTIEVLNSHSNGPMLLKIDNLRIALGRNMADDIMVSKIA